ncbi:MAG: hypothetical protein NEHIOOID_00007 [Holosporales bacterium]
MKKFYFLAFCFSLCHASDLSDPGSNSDNPPLQIFKGDDTDTQSQRSETDQKISSWMGRISSFFNPIEKKKITPFHIKRNKVF